MNNYVIRYLWSSNQNVWWYHIKIYDKETYSTSKITHPEVMKMPAKEVKKTVSLIKENYKRGGYAGELVLEIIDIKTLEVVSLKELGSISQLDLNGDISRFELIDFD